MALHATMPLFAWDALEDTASLRTIRAFFEELPDEQLLAGLRQARGRGRNDYRVDVLWRVVVLSRLLRHTTINACLAELHRNADLCRIAGIDSEDQIPRIYNVSRFMDVLGQQPHLSRLHEAFDLMAQRLGEAVPDLGRHTAGDAAALNARRSRDNASPSDRSEGQQGENTGKIERDAHGLAQPSGGRKEYTDDQGKVVKAVEWFGYKFHVLVDTKHEVILAYQVTSTKTGDNEALPPLLEEAEKNLPDGRIETVAYDKAADDSEVHRMLDERGTKPVIQTRSMWSDDQERMLPEHGANDNVVYDEAGTVYCYDKVSDPPVRHPMAYMGHEKQRETLKYRCPAAHHGWSCPSEHVCNANRPFGMTVRVKREIDLRRFPSIPRATKTFERLYKGRTSVERVIGRMKMFWGVDDGNIARATRFHAMVGVSMLVHAGFATLLAREPRWEGTYSHTQLGTVARRLDEVKAKQREHEKLQAAGLA